MLFLELVFYADALLEKVSDGAVHGSGLRENNSDLFLGQHLEGDESPHLVSISERSVMLQPYHIHKTMLLLGKDQILSMYYKKHQDWA
jgi:hypothetical protein